MYNTSILKLNIGADRESQVRILHKAVAVSYGFSLRIKSEYLSVSQAHITPYCSALRISGAGDMMSYENMIFDH
jgi:hypothetical protein